MGLLISNAAGSRQLAGEIAKRPGHPPVELCDMKSMPFGDAMIPFNGPPSVAPMVVGVEIKKLGDLLACIQSGRYSGHQLLGCANTYDLSVLLIEGVWRMNTQTGVLESFGQLSRGQRGWKPVSTGPRKWMYRELNRYLLTMGLVGGVQIWRTCDQPETVQTLLDIHDLGLKKWDDHDTLKAHNNVNVEELKYRTMPDGSRRMQFQEPTFEEKIAIQFDGLGVTRAREVAAHFDCVKAMVNADEAEWREIPGIGKKLAAGIVKAVSAKKEAIR